MGLEELIQVDLDSCERCPVFRRGIAEAVGERIEGLDEVDHTRHVVRQVVVVIVAEVAPATSESTPVEPLIAARLAARKSKNWAESDRIREQLAAMGVTLRDAKDPSTGDIVTTWEVV